MHKPISTRTNTPVIGASGTERRHHMNGTVLPAPKAAAARAPVRSARRPAIYGAPPAVYAGGTAFTPGSGGAPYAVTTRTYAANSAQPNEWYAAPGPMRRGNMCITHTDSLRGYGYQAPCK